MARIGVANRERFDFGYLEDGTETTVQISYAEAKESKNNVPYLSLKLSVLGQGDDIDDIYQTVFLPGPKEEAEDMVRWKKSSNRFNDFLDCFDVKLDKDGGFDTDNLIGLSGDVVVGYQDDPQYGESNYIKSYIVPK